jgi:hypothetical protein
MGITMTDISKHITLAALLTFLSVVTFGCDSATLSEDVVVEQDHTFATQDAAESQVSSPVATAVVEEDEDVTLEDLAHTATTVGEMTETDISEETTSDDTVVEEPVVEEPVVEEPVVDDTVVEEPTVEEPIAEIFAAGSEGLAWTPNGTYKLPSYGSGCRFVTDHLVQIPSNGVLDDSVVFAADAGPDATFELAVETATGLSVVADVDMKRGLTGRSYRQADGQATWTDKEGQHTGWVVDGTLCFDEKLANGMGDVLAEFSLIVEIDGIYHSMGGNVLIEGGQVTANDGYAVDAALAVDVDLR